MHTRWIAITLIVVVLLLQVPGLAQTQDELLASIQNLSRIDPMPAHSGNATLSMYEYINWLNTSASGFMAFFNQLLSLLGMGNQGFTGNTSEDLQGSLQKVLNQLNGSAGSL